MKSIALLMIGVFAPALKAEIPAGATDLVPRSDSPAAESLKINDESVTIISNSEFTNASLAHEFADAPKAGRVLLLSESGEVEGLTLRSELAVSETSSSVPKVVLVFRVTNKSNSPVWRSYATQSFGFKLTGISLDKKTVAYSVAGSALFDEPRTGSYRGRAIEPGESVEFKLSPEVLPSLFVEPIQSFSVGWSKGLGESAETLPEIPGLAIKLDLKTITKLVNELGSFKVNK